jgi:hypothetical protein
MLINETDKFRDKYFLLMNGDAGYLRSKGLMVQPEVSHIDHNITILTMKFLNPATRSKKMDTLMLARIYRP